MRRSSSALTRSRWATTACSTGAGARSLNDQMKAHGLELFAPDLEMFTLGGGGAHCLGQALHREAMGAE